jgi:hypothetical protein
MRNRSQESEVRSQKGEKPRMNADERGLLANIGWRDEARAASLAVRRAKAAARGAAGGKARGRGGKAGKGKDPRENDNLGWFEEEGLASMSQEGIDALTEEIRQKLADGKERLSASEEGFLEELRYQKGYVGEDHGDPIFDWQEKRAMTEQNMRDATGMDFRDARAKAGDLAQKEADGTPLTPDEESFLEVFRAVMQNRQGMPIADCRMPNGEPTPAYGHPSEEGMVIYLVNTGWTDAARVASLAVRRAKAAVRGRPGGGRVEVVPPRDEGIYPGGSKDFDERTGRYRTPREGEMPPHPLPKPGTGKSVKKPPVYRVVQQVVRR